MSEHSPAPAIDAYRAQTRETMQAFSDEALALQDSLIVGGIDREECDREILRRMGLRTSSASAPSARPRPDFDPRIDYPERYGDGPY